jgi:8-oxo-dGTP diphosphatase
VTSSISMAWHSVPLRAAVILDCPLDEVVALVGRISLWQRWAASLGFEFSMSAEADGSWCPAELRISRLDGKARWTAQVDLVTGLPEFVVQSGPAAGARLRLLLSETGAGVLLTADFGSSSRSGAPSHSLSRFRAAVQSKYRRRIIDALHVLVGMVLLETHQTRLVVAAAIVRGDRVLAARKPTTSASEAGVWEFPGGKVGRTEDPAQALVREIREELAVVIEVERQLGPEISLGVETVLRLYRATLVTPEGRAAAAQPADRSLDDGQPHDSAEPKALEHDELRWLSADELDEVEWLPADHELLYAVRQELAAARPLH